MTLNWTDWKAESDKARGRTPYVDWYSITELGGSLEGNGFEIFSPAKLPQWIPIPMVPMSIGWPVSGYPDEDIYLKGTSEFVPLPAYAKGPDPTEPPPDVLGDIGAPPLDAVVTAIIDSGLALAHERFRHADGNTRFLAVWQQGANWRKKRQKHLPFGRELRQNEINALMATHGGLRQVDEEMFNRAAGSANFDFANGDRAVEFNASHGTHVLDLAAGCNPDDQTAEPQRTRRPIIGVALPMRPSIGPSGSFLEYFVIQAIAYIVKMSDRIWEEHYSRKCPHVTKGFPIVINLSYGLQAGPKDGNMRIEKYIQAMQDWRCKYGWSPLRLALPAGNDNLERGVASFSLVPGASEPLQWRIRPEDRTSSYAEVWTDVLKDEYDKTEKHPFFVSLETPDGTRGPGTCGAPGEVCDLVDNSTPTAPPLARIYCRYHDDSVLQNDGSVSKAPTMHRIYYVLCVAPTYNLSGLSAPGGTWTIRLGRNVGSDHTLEVAGDLERRGSSSVFLFVQSDQDLTFGGRTGLTSYFDAPSYEIYEEDGRLVDTYSYPTDGGPPVLLDTAFPVRRQNSLNAIANRSVMTVAAGYRATDGRPAPYSSTGRGFTRGDGRAGPTAAFPSDDGAAHFGRLAAGAKSGAVAVMQGTSFATAEATRAIVDALAGWNDNGRPCDTPIGTDDWWAAAPGKEAPGDFPVPLGDLEMKIGHGRFPAADHGRTPRRNGLG